MLSFPSAAPETAVADNTEVLLDVAVTVPNSVGSVSCCTASWNVDKASES